MFSLPDTHSDTQLERPRQQGIVARNLRRIDKGALRALVDLEILGWHIELKDCRWFAKDDREWVGFPVQIYTTPSGQKNYNDIIKFTDRDAGDRFAKAALAAVHRLNGS